MHKLKFKSSQLIMRVVTIVALILTLSATQVTGSASSLSYVTRIVDKNGSQHVVYVETNASISAPSGNVSHSTYSRYILIMNRSFTSCTQVEASDLEPAYACVPEYAGKHLAVFCCKYGDITESFTGNAYASIKYRDINYSKFSYLHSITVPEDGRIDWSQTDLGYCVFVEGYKQTQTITANTPVAKTYNQSPFKLDISIA